MEDSFYPKKYKSSARRTFPCMYLFLQQRAIKAIISFQPKSLVSFDEVRACMVQHLLPLERGMCVVKFTSICFRSKTTCLCWNIEINMEDSCRSFDIIKLLRWMKVRFLKIFWNIWRSVLNLLFFSELWSQISFF